MSPTVLRNTCGLPSTQCAARSMSACSVSGAICGRDEDCACRGFETNCTPGQTCILGPDAEDSRLYHTTKWDHAPVQDYPKPFLEVDSDEGLRWTCNMVNGVEGDPTRPPKKCHQGCNSCEWRPERSQCVFERERPVVAQIDAAESGQPIAVDGEAVVKHAETGARNPSEPAETAFARRRNGRG